MTRYIALLRAVNVGGTGPFEARDPGGTARNIDTVAIARKP